MLEIKPEIRNNLPLCTLSCKESVPGVCPMKRGGGALCNVLVQRVFKSCAKLVRIQRSGLGTIDLGRIDQMMEIVQQLDDWGIEP